MKVTIEIDLDNAAFEDDPGELGRILKYASGKLDRHLGYAPDAEFSRALMDINGNTVGMVRIA